MDFKIRNTSYFGPVFDFTVRGRIWTQRTVDNKVKLDQNTVRALKMFASALGIKGYSKLRKAELVKLLLESENLPAQLRKYN